MTTVPDPPPQTSLDLPDGRSEPAVESTSLVLPDEQTPPSPLADPEPADRVPADLAPAESAATGPLGDLFAAQMQRVEIAMLSRILATTLAGALPPSMVRVERRRTVGQRLHRQPESVIGVSVDAGDKTLTFRAPAVGDIHATVSHTVRGVVLSSASVPVAEWLSQLADVLNAASADDHATRTALQQALL